MNYKKLSLKEIEEILATNEFQKLTDEEAFQLMQRRNELTNNPSPNDFTGFKKTGDLRMKEMFYTESNTRYFKNGIEYNKEDYNK